jgi:hypothetical protein
MFSFLKRSRKPSPASRRSSPPGFRPMFEGLEDRQLLSASAVSNLGNALVQFNLLDNGHLQQTVGRVQTDLGIVQGLYQGKDVAGHEVAYELVSHTLKEFTPDRGWVALGAADLVAQGAGETVFFTRGTTLYLATGAPGTAVPLLANVQGLTVTGGQASVQIGSAFKADVGVQLNPSGAATLSFTNVQMNVGQFAGDFLGKAVTNLQSFTKPLGSLADALNKPLLTPSWASGFTTTWLLGQLGYGQAAADAKAFAEAVQAINGLAASFSVRDGWVNLGSFSAQVQSPTQLKVLDSTTTSAAAIDAQLAGVSDLLRQLKSIPGLQVALDDPKQMLKLITGENVTLFSYTLSVPHAISVTKQQQLAAIPVSPETATEFDLSADLGVSLSGSATFGFDTTGFQSGNLAKGFFVQNAGLTASVSAGLSGLLNEANLVGYEVTGAVTGSVTAKLKGADGSGKVYADQISAGGIVFSPPNWKFGITTKALGPQQMLSRAIEQYGPYLKTLVGTDAQVAANILNGKGVTPTEIARAIGTPYGIPPDKTASIMKNAGVKLNDIASALKGAGVKLSEVTAAVQNLVGGALDQEANQLKQTVLGTAQNWYNSAVAQFTSQEANAVSSWNQYVNGATSTYNSTVASWTSWKNSAIAVQNSWLNDRKQEFNNGVASWASYMDSKKAWAASQLATVHLTLKDIGFGLFGGVKPPSFQQIVSDAKGDGQKIINGIQSGVQYVGSQLQVARQEATAATVNFVNSIKSQLTDELNNAQKQIQGWKDWLQGCQNSFDRAVAGINSQFTNAINSAAATLTAAKDLAAKNVQGWKDWLQGAINQASAQLTGMKNVIPSLVAQARQTANNDLAQWVAADKSHQPADLLQATESAMATALKQSLAKSFPTVSW